MHEEPSTKSLDEHVVMAGTVEAEKPAEESVSLVKDVKEAEEEEVEEKKVTAKNAQAAEEKSNVEDKPVAEPVLAKSVNPTEEEIEADDSPAAEQVTANHVTGDLSRGVAVDVQEQGDYAIPQRSTQAVSGAASQVDARKVGPHLQPIVNR